MRVVRGERMKRRVELAQIDGRSALVLMVGQRVDDALIRQMNELLEPFDSPDECGRRVLTYKEAAALLKISTKTLQRRVAKGLVPYRLIGGRVRFLGEDLDRIKDQALRNGSDEDSTT